MYDISGEIFTGDVIIGEVKVIHNTITAYKMWVTQPRCVICICNTSWTLYFS